VTSHISDCFDAKAVAYPQGVLGGLSLSVCFFKLDIILLKQKSVDVNYETGVNYSNELPVKIVILYFKKY